MTFLIMEDQQLFTIQTMWMISYRSTLTNRTGLGRKEGEVSAVHLHRDPVFLTGKFDPILHRTDSPVNDLWMNLPVVNSWTSLPPVNYVLPDRADRNSSLRTGLPVHYLPEGTGRDKSQRPNPRNRIGLDRTGCQSPDESTGHGTVELSTGQRTLDKSTGQFKQSSVQHGRIPMGQRSSTEQPTTIRYMGHSSGRGPTVTIRNRYSTGLDQTNSSDYRKMGY